MKLTLEQVRNVAALARLGLSPEEMERMRDQLSSILTSIEKIEELDTAAIPPTAQTIDLTDIVRDDVAEPSLPLELVLRNAPRHRDGFFEVHTPFAGEVTES
jgi:aspartyl-tRNA(Asn)/glutamyl-tRNA(Gln) amidotransferase subunit C